MLGGIFLGAVILPFLFLLLKLTHGYPSLEAFLLSVLPAFIVYSGGAFFVLNKWVKRAPWQKYGLIAIGAQYAFLFIWGCVQLLFLNRVLSGPGGWLVAELRTFLSPLETLYGRYVIFPRMTADRGAACFRLFYWETGLLFVFFRIIYAGVVGLIVGKLAEKIRQRSKWDKGRTFVSV